MDIFLVATLWWGFLLLAIPAVRLLRRNLRAGRETATGTHLKRPPKLSCGFAAGAGDGFFEAAASRLVSTLFGSGQIPGHRENYRRCRVSPCEHDTPVDAPRLRKYAARTYETVY